MTKIIVHIAPGDPAQYPTKEEILKDPYVPSRGEDFFISIFGFILSHGWDSLTEKLQLQTLNALADALSSEHRVRAPLVRGNGVNCYRYDKEDGGTVLIGHTLSVISFLHEVGHHIFGDSELAACRYSVGLYRIINPTLKGLTWQGHLLVPSSRQATVKSKSAKRRTIASRSRSKRRGAGTS